jgi:DNA-binding MarR family transcriptional regulator
VTHKDLVALAAGRLSPATLSRAVQDAVLLGLLRQEPLAGNRRVKRLLLTDAGWRLLAAGAEEAFAAARETIRRAEAAMAAG